MIQLVDQALEQFLRREVPLPAADVDVSFDAPDRKWGSGVTRPTVNLFLYDIRKSPNRTKAGVDVVEQAGKTYRRRAPSGVDLHYFVTTWASEHRDEHQLLGAVVRAVVSRSALPRDVLHPELGEQVTMGLGDLGQQNSSEFWSALDGQLKPGLQVRLGITVVGGDLVEAGPPTAGVELGVHDRTREPAQERGRGSVVAQTFDDDGRPVRTRHRRAQVEEPGPGPG